MSRITTQLPLCFTEEGQKIIEKKGLELQNWLDTEGYKSRESFYILDMEDAKYPKIMSWWNTDICQDTYREFIHNRENHYVNGEKWNNGQFGSRWADITIEGIRVRLGFYSRQFDPKMFENFEIYDKNLKINMIINYLIVVSVLDYQEELFMTREEEDEKEEERLAKIQHEKNQEEETKRLEEAKTKADKAEEKLLAEEKAKKDAEEIKKSLPKKKKEKKVKEAKVAVNPHKKEIRVSEGIWKPNPAWKKWEQENKRSASPP